MGPAARSDEPSRPPAGHIALRLPARAEYIALCRTLAATVGEICRLDASTIVDLKLAVTEAASEFLSDMTDDEDTVDFAFRLHDDRLVMELSGPTTVAPPDEQELSRAIIEATVDRADFAAGRTLLMKRLEP